MITSTKQKPLLSIAIPTYNRADFLQNFLAIVLPQAHKLGGTVQICISNNASSDNTRAVVMGFKETYPDLIQYHENERNLGFDANILKAIEIADGEFVWTFGDDDVIMGNGLYEVVDSIRGIDKKNTGLIVIRTESYFIDEKTGDKMVYYNSFDPGRPQTFEIKKEEIVASTFPDISFMSALVFNNGLVKNMFTEDKAALEASHGTHHAHVPLYVYMFLKYPGIKGVVLNSHPIVRAGIASYRGLIEDKFMLHYYVQKKLNALLLSYQYMDKDHAFLIANNDKKLMRIFTVDMLVMRAFKSYDCLSYVGCLKLFFRQATFIEALVFSFVFSVLFLIPPAMLIGAYKVLLMIRFGKSWKLKWEVVSRVASVKTKGIRRRNDLAT